MAWTFSDPENIPKDAVRSMVGDTDPADHLISDEEINHALSEWDSTYRAAANICERLAAKFAREVTHSGDGLSFSGSDLHKHYMDLADRLLTIDRRKRARGAKPYAGGISWAERKADDADSDLIQTHIRSHDMDNPRAGRTYDDADELKSDQ